MVRQPVQTITPVELFFFFPLLLFPFPKSNAYPAAIRQALLVGTALLSKQGNEGDSPSSLSIPFTCNLPREARAAMQPLCAALELEAATSSRLSARNTTDSIA